MSVKGGRRSAAGGGERNAGLQQAPSAQRFAHAEPRGWRGGGRGLRVEGRVQENEGGGGDADGAPEQGPGLESEGQACSRGVRELFVRVGVVTLSRFQHEPG